MAAPSATRSNGLNRRRRDLLRAALAGLVVPLPGLARSTSEAVIAGCRMRQGGGHALSVVDAASGSARWNLALPGRGHDVLMRPRGRELLAFARRPGAFLCVADPRRGEWLHRVDAAPGRHFYGHGAFSADGRWLYAAENDFQAGRGVVGVYDADDGYRRVDEFDSHGIGPHEIVRLPGRDVLAVANGGLRTHPDFPRAILNRDDMRPNLALLDPGSGRRLARAEPPAAWNQLSVRHLAAGADGRLCIALQYQGPRDERPPLVAFSDGDSFELVEPPAAVLERMRNYCGSVVWLASAEWFAVTSPHEGVITLWSATQGYVGLIETQAETSALCAVDAGRALWAGGGETLRGIRYPDRDTVTRRSDGYYWGNHMLAV